MNCHKFYDAKTVFSKEEIPKCICRGIIKLDVVLYEEELDQQNLTKAIKIIQQADLFIVGETSLTVFPAVGLIKFFKGDYFFN